MSANSFADVEYVVRTIAQTAVDNEKEFGDLDAVVGDGDFGYSLARGFEIVLDDWDTYDRTDIGTFLKKIAVVITSRIGGTSGPIWGTAFLRAGRRPPARPRSPAPTSSPCCAPPPRASTPAGQGRARREDPAGRPDPGHRHHRGGRRPGRDRRPRSPGPQRQPPGEAAEATKTMEARRGRASYTGERSIGSVDAGAMALAIIAERIADNWPAD